MRYMNENISSVVSLRIYTDINLSVARIYGHLPPEQGTSLSILGAR